MLMIMMMLCFRNAIISYVIICSSESASLCVSGSRLDARDFLSPFPKVVSLSMPCALATLIIAFRAGKKMMQGTENRFQAVPPGRRFLIRQAFLADISPWVACRHSEQRYVNRASEFSATPCSPGNRLCVVSQIQALCITFVSS